jgi:hypothetical protein
VVAAPDCCWAPQVDRYSDCFLDNVVSDVTITAGSEGCGGGTVCFSYGATPIQCTQGRLVPIRFGVQRFKAIQEPLPTLTPPP